ncbi:hypothetical protein [Secundilactobacillus kimchicus]|uniref:hypothetical protein n=1 Tax=Secundilactobacillus kimchicus TaxID=528209 RepID=UPI0024A83AA8|nr:hypothetical protein [Secundilactobacillus kimchicus]
MVYEGPFEITHVLADGKVLTDEEMKHHVINDKAVIRVLVHAILHYEQTQGELKQAHEKKVR